MKDHAWMFVRKSFQVWNKIIGQKIVQLLRCVCDVSRSKLLELEWRNGHLNFSIAVNEELIWERRIKLTQHDKVVRQSSESEKLHNWYFVVLEMNFLINIF